MNMHRFSRRICPALGLALAGLVSSWSALAQEKAAREAQEPLWEVGAGAGLVAVPAYKGSATTRTFVAPLPYFVYRGEYFRANRDGLRADIWRGERWRTDLSLSGSLPVRSSGTAREGMDNLAPSVELGGGITYDLYKNSATDGKVSLILPIRHALTLEKRGIHSIGWLFAPTLRTSGNVKIAGQSWDWGSNLTFNFADRTYNAHYYDVTAADVTASRPLYNSRGGNAGVSLTAGAKRRIGNWWLSGFVGVSNIGHARFADSPLVEKKTNWYSGVALIWIFDKSGTMVSAQRDED